ncbi:hypothetical protein AgCh_022766 [Apium graveolens]
MDTGPKKVTLKKRNKGLSFDITFKLNIDELIQEFDKVELTTLADTKDVGLTLTGNLEGFIALYGKLKKLVVESKKEKMNVASDLVNRMLKSNMFLLGAVDLKEGMELDVHHLKNMSKDFERAEIGDVSNLKGLELDGNDIHGSIPHWIWNVSENLEVMNLRANYLTAFEHDPVDIQSKSLRSIDISNNMLQGNLPVPPSNTNLYFVKNNRLTGDISPMICGVMSLKVLDLSNNSMSGPIPQCLADSMEFLVLKDNNFSGTIPQIYQKECDLKVLDLSQNQLTREVPSNFLTGALPAYYIQIWNVMKDFRTDMEQYIETKTESLWIIGRYPLTSTASYHTSIILTNKGVEIDYDKILNVFTAIDLSSNKFTGQIPESLGSLVALQLLNLSNNDLTGLCGFLLSKNCGTKLSPPDENKDDPDDDKLPSGLDWLFILVGLGSGLVIGFVLGDILVDRHPWLIPKTVQKFGSAQKKPRMRNRQIIWA